MKKTVTLREIYKEAHAKCRSNPNLVLIDEVIKASKVWKEKGYQISH